MTGRHHAHHARIAARHCSPSLHVVARSLLAWSLCAIAATVAPASHTFAITAQTQPTANRTLSDDDAELNELLDTIDRLAAEVRDLSADFEQHKHTPLLRRPLVSTGRVRMVGAVVRWDTREPSPSVLVIDDDTLQLYDPGQSTLEVYTIDRDLARLAASPVPDVATLRKHFTITQHYPEDAVADADRALLHLHLAPRQDELKQRVDHVLLTLRRADARVVRAEIAQADDERTIMNFTNHRANTGLDEDDLRLDVPDGTRIIRPQQDGDDARNSAAAATRDPRSAIAATDDGHPDGPVRRLL